MKQFLISETTPEYSLYIEAKKPLPPDIAKHLYRCGEALSNHFSEKTKKHN